MTDLQKDIDYFARCAARHGEYLIQVRELLPEGVTLSYDEIPKAVKDAFDAKDAALARVQRESDRFAFDHNVALRRAEGFQFDLDKARVELAQLRAELAAKHDYACRMDALVEEQTIKLTAAEAALGRLPLERDARSPDFWRCRTCGCLWRDNHDGSVSLSAVKQTSCAECEMKGTPETCDPLFRLADRDEIGKLNTLATEEWADKIACQQELETLRADVARLRHLAHQLVEAAQETVNFLEMVDWNDNWSETTGVNAQHALEVAIEGLAALTEPQP